MSEVRAAGTIYDLGYQRYGGERLGRAFAVRTLGLFSFRSAFGLGRGERAKVIPMIVAAICFLPALVQVSIASASGMSGLINYPEHLRFTAFFIALFTAAQAPELIVTDRQHGVLSLYLSRPLRSTDYALAKLGAFVAAILVLALGPQLVLFTGKVFLNATPWTAFVDEYAQLVPIVGGTLVVSIFLASVAPRRYEGLR